MMQPKNKFQFVDAEFMTARDKELTLKDWERFLSRGLGEKFFTKRLYHHLMQHCSFIAHYNREGFFSVYFAGDYEATRRFLNQFVTGRSAEMPGDWWQDRENRLGYRDINSAMMEVAKLYVPNLLQSVDACERGADLMEAQRLLAKHDYAICPSTGHGKYQGKMCPKCAEATFDCPEGMVMP